ncbi:LIPO protein, partial [Alectura lathami]|nr:LIPO protein [Alectura lathami]
MQATLLSILGLALLGALHAQDSVPVQADFQQDKVTPPGPRGAYLPPKVCSEGLPGGWGPSWPGCREERGTRCVLSPCPWGALGPQFTAEQGMQDVGCSLWGGTERVWGCAGGCWGSSHDIRVVETNYDEYALVATRISKNAGSSNMVLLYSRTKELSPERLERFTQFSREQGLNDEEILILPQTDKCMADAA